MKKKPTYDGREVCLCCGARPTNQKTGPASLIVATLVAMTAHGVRYQTCAEHPECDVSFACAACVADVAALDKQLLDAAPVAKDGAAPGLPSVSGDDARKTESSPACQECAALREQRDRWRIECERLGNGIVETLEDDSPDPNNDGSILPEQAVDAAFEAIDTLRGHARELVKSERAKEAECAALQQRAKDLEDALRALAAEVRGSLGFAKREMIGAIGVTNCAVMERKLAEAETALSPSLTREP